MMYPILVEPERILSWEEFDNHNSRNLILKVLRHKASIGHWQSMPPIIVSPMPSEYRGRYRHFVYNGHSRLMVARELDLPLMGLVIEQDKEIPPDELIIMGGRSKYKHVCIEKILRQIIDRKVDPHPTINYDNRENLDRSYMVQEFMKWEQGRKAEYK